MNVKFNNYSMRAEERNKADWYEWCVFVDESQNVVNSIKSVEYTLHPTFPNPVRTITDKVSRFALYSAGWGIFRIKILVSFEDDSSFETSHYLHLKSNDWPRKKAPTTFDSTDTKSVYQVLWNEKYRWRKFDTVVRNSHIPQDKVKVILEDLQSSNLVRKGYFLSIDGKEIWGATDIVGISPKLDPL